MFYQFTVVVELHVIAAYCATNRIGGDANTVRTVTCNINNVNKNVFADGAYKL